MYTCVLLMSPCTLTSWCTPVYTTPYTTTQFTSLVIWSVGLLCRSFIDFKTYQKLDLDFEIKTGGKSKQTKPAEVGSSISVAVTYFDSSEHSVILCIYL